jgi:hypothetical protein
MAGANGGANVTPAAGGAAGDKGAAGANGGASNGMGGRHFTEGNNATAPAVGVNASGGGGGGAGRIAVRAIQLPIQDQTDNVSPDPKDINHFLLPITIYGVAGSQ